MRLVALINSMGDIDQSWGGGPVLLWMYVPPWILAVASTLTRLQSFAETNLSCICGALPTVKPLLNHLAPRLLGSSANSKYAKKSGLSDPNAPPTFGAGGAGDSSQGRKYRRFDDDIMYPLETVVAVEGGDESGSDVAPRDDSGSETSIVPARPSIRQTKTATVTYEARK
jgi:hypothetical protein